MNFDGAETAKAEIFLEAFGFSAIASPASADDAAGPVFLPLPDTAPYDRILEARMRKRITAEEGIAIGTLGQDGHNRNPDALKLGIFIQHERLRSHPIVEKALGIARGEARIIFTGPIRTREAVNGNRCRPLKIGGSVGHHRVTAGTLGCFCRSRTGGGIGVLSNNHILADTNKGSPGDIILQPGHSDGGRLSERTSHIGTLDRHVTINNGPGTTNVVDCAFASLLNLIEYNAHEVCDPLDPTRRWAIGALETQVVPGDAVRKVGRTTGFTAGRIKATRVNNVVVQMSFDTGWTIARFDNQISIEGSGKPFSERGDSGAVIFTSDGRPFGLLFAGTDGTRGTAAALTYANRLDSVLAALDIEIYTSA
ncbi:MAG: hypothetical protein Q7T93_17280 [Methylobacterium sp.]|uniref:hypothetical protein n=1 Tax=unclassified Methylobacterium TaxID=2615210 RepID=UPI0011CC38E4|nr:MULTISPECIES: hypothetical protein [unclassified Methylobacterium]MDO9428569.1 hypothetical protein [Methylobacterium sp.]TXM73746.1 hypothetical protein FV218_11065 [Methylobacterium sp. WL69]